ncbi:MAG: FAD:protein FMN transferase [Candidatus Thioglobus sp.]|nr:FAD:protein FMN transferase [Candidatus Thioglobus sp.]
MLRALLIAIFLLLSACGVDDTVQTITGKTMGTTYTVKTVGNGVSKSEIEHVLNQVNQIFSTWDPNSELSLLNKKPIDQWIKVSSELYFVLSESKRIHQGTQGYFDPGIGKLIDLWGFGAVKVAHKPTRGQVEKTRQRSSIQYLQLKNGKVKKIKDIRINLSAIAKGFGVDQVARLLNELWIKNFLVEIGGEVIARGRKGDKEWMIGIEQPGGAVPISINLNNKAVATSGNYRNYFVWEGERYTHILEPTTGLPIKNDLTSVSVLHDQTVVADAYATAMMAMGSEKATVLAQRLNLSVLLILNERFDSKVVKINL